jgi:cytochrome c oxidase assembly factor CtaG
MVADAGKQNYGRQRLWVAGCVAIAVGWYSGSRYSTIQALEPMALMDTRQGHLR